VVFDGRDTSHRALALAAQLAGEEKRGVTVLVAPGDDAKAPELEEQAANLLRENHVPVEYRRQLDTSSAAGLLDALDAAHLGALVLPADLDWLTRDALDDLLDAAECAVLLVR
jgi:hypothetical protein